MADNFEIMDPTESRKLTRIDTEHLFKLAQWKAMEYGMVKYQNLGPYKNAVEQMEILAEGSALLKNKYWDEKKKIRQQVQKGISHISESYRPGLRRSLKNEQINKQVDNAEINFVTMWHRLLIRTLAPLFYTTYRVTKI
tara:strand:+ start:850 stop:1266 length:417 start_codon:yes stop_codon:yes gene_type:complete